MQLSHVMYAGLHTGRWISVSQPSKVIGSPENEAQLEIMALLPSPPQQHDGSALFTPEYGVAEYIFLIFAGESYTSESMIMVVT